MADYWKSQPKKFCQYCKCWIADNKPCIEFHERGKNHKENVAAKIEEIKKKSVAKAKQEKKMSKEFAAMEEAAQKAYEEDLKRLTGTGESLSPAPAPAPARPQTKSKKFEVKGKMKVKESRKIQTGSIWVEGRTDDGQIYYYNTITGESQWENPDVFQGGSTSSSSSSPSSSLLLPPGTGEMQVISGGGWMEAVSPDGYTYYYNTQTGESSWDKPHDLNTQDRSSHEETQEEAPPPQPESPSESDAAPPQPDSLCGGEETSESPKETKEEPADAKQTKVPKISFRKRKEEPDQTSGDDGGQKVSDEEKPQEKKEEVTSAPAAVEVKVTPAKKPRKINPYGAWEQIQPEDDPYEKVDLQLPHTATAVTAPAAPDLAPEPRPKFKERTITSLGQGEEGNAGGETFKKRKTENGKSRSLRQRDDDD
ncbi:WW domain-binding protein 4 [Paramisgurnus dabryanus]|uniref:WW domain-binding protein 4 n=1 Tax=Paramisgurnus dabryanus TaxID=90735 RepID=UPI0031F37E43